MGKLMVEREEKNGAAWTFLLLPSANTVLDMRAGETAFSKTVGYGWRYGLEKASSAPGRPCLWDIVADLTYASCPDPNLEIEFTCGIIKGNRNISEPLPDLRQCRSISPARRSRLGYCDKIGSFLDLWGADCILVEAYIHGDLVLAQSAFAPPLKAVAAKQATPPMKLDMVDALERSLASGNFTDTKFNVFSCWRKVGGGRQRLCRPLPLHAATSVVLNRLDLKCSLNFGELWGWRSIVAEEGAISERRKALRDMLCASDCERSFLDVGDEYEEDSDFDPDEESVIEESPHGGSTLCPPAPGATLSNSDATISVARPENTTSKSKNAMSGGVPPIHSTFLVKGVAYKTWRAFLFYIYTGQVNFSPMSPQNGGKVEPDSLANETKLKCSPCSPKSMYRLAIKVRPPPFAFYEPTKLTDHSRLKLQLEPLKQLAFDEIRRHLTKDTILHEVLSKFTAKHPEILEMEMNFLMNHRSESGVMDSLPEKIEQMMRGEMTHCKEVLATIMMNLWKKA
ncbi:hypothetical protein CONPUDRAFT_163852 [Coniophora puteana RWD-64-598 SS2]|uniref:BTB domain-containing protein n=1 Tax=Coniophora puteana (strain RWD-64-598) TaxID=741705 RepID=A0A5M3MVN5_CONPW|nr:uncharacterized protein CONPUDRAFT_163852 [Coniophora puteana RWD-64-598 SS2]EIW82774.1 hypothetical protein CONPUDRAFT_163852 [Coniophora puteana RWD-64-598 SS2]